MVMIDPTLRLADHKIVGTPDETQDAAILDFLGEGLIRATLGSEVLNTGLSKQLTLREEDGMVRVVIGSADSVTPDVSILVHAVEMRKFFIDYPDA